MNYKYQLGRYPKRVGVGVYPDKESTAIILSYGFDYAQPPAKIDFRCFH